MYQHPKHTGIDVRHRATCSTKRGGERCTCSPIYQASVWFAREGKRRKKHFSKLAEAKAWRQDASAAIRAGTLAPPKRTTLDEAAAKWLEGIEAGTITSKSRRPFKPSTVRGYRRSLEQQILPAIGNRRLADLTRQDIQGLADKWLEDGLSASAIGNRLDPLRSIYRRAIKRGEVVVNPTASLDLEAAGTRKAIRIATPVEAHGLLAALPADDRALWATAFYAGLRRGELLALRWSDIDLARSEIRVSRSWDQKAGPIDPKSETSSRTVPLLAVLRDYLDQHKLATGRDGEDLAFGRTATEPPVPSTVRIRALKSWEAAGIESVVGLHDARHTFASTLIDAGTNPKAIQDYMGHSTIQMTFDRYGHLMPGRRDETRKQMDAYLESALSS